MEPFGTLVMPFFDVGIRLGRQSLLGKVGGKGLVGIWMLQMPFPGNELQQGDVDIRTQQCLHRLPADKALARQYWY